MIKFKCTKNTSKLIFHSHADIQINNNTVELTSLTDANFKTIKTFDWNYDKETQFLSADFNKNIFIEKNSYLVNIGFTGRVKNDYSGLYRNKYVDSKGVTKYNF